MLALSPSSILTPQSLGPSGIGGGFVGPLDEYETGLAQCWSVCRRLLTTHTGSLIRIRRSNDDTELDIGYDSAGALDLDAVTDFVGSNSAFVTKIYSQLADGLDFIQPTASSQRRIVNAGTLDTLDGLPTARATGNQGYYTSTGSTYTGTAASAFVRASVGTDVQYDRILSATLDDDFDYNAERWIPFLRYLGDESLANWSAAFLSQLGITYGSSFVASSIFDGSNSMLTIGASSDDVAFTGSITVNRFLLGLSSRTTGACGDPAKWSEGVVYLSDKTSEETAIRAALTP